MKIASKRPEKVTIRHFLLCSATSFLASITRQRIYWCVSLAVVLIAEGLEAIGDGYIATAEDGVVAHHLSQCLLTEPYAWLLTLDDKQRLSICRQHHDVGTLRHTIYIYRILLDYLFGLVAALRGKVGHHVAAHPLLGGEHKPSLAHAIEDLGATSLATPCTKANRWIVEFRVVHITLTNASGGEDKIVFVSLRKGKKKKSKTNVLWIDKR